MGRRGRAIVAASAVGMIGLTAALAPASGGAEGETPAVVAVRIESPVRFNFGVTPTRLPSHETGRTKLELGLEVSPFTSGVQPGLREATIGLDRSIALEPGDLPVCRWPGAEGIQIEPSANDECARAVVGRVEAKIEVALPESVPIQIPVEGKAYNGGVRRGATDLLVELPLQAPLSGAIQLIVPFRPVRQGRIGSEATITVPTLAGGFGRLLSIKLELRRGFTQDGERAGYVAAQCRDGRWAATLSASLTDGALQEPEERIRACTRLR